MKLLFEYRFFRVFEISHDALEIIGATNSRYVRNSFLVFEPGSCVFELGSEWRAVSSVVGAKKVIDDFYLKRPLVESLKNAELRSRQNDECRRRELLEYEVKRQRERNPF